MQKPEGSVEEKTKKTMKAAVRDTAWRTPEYHQMLQPPFFFRLAQNLLVNHLQCYSSKRIGSCEIAAQGALEIRIICCCVGQNGVWWGWVSAGPLQPVHWGVLEVWSGPCSTLGTWLKHTEVFSYPNRWWQLSLSGTCSPDRHILCIQYSWPGLGWHSRDLFLSGDASP